MRRTRLVLGRLALLAVILGGGAACGNKPDKGDCEKLLDHLVDLEAAESGGGAVPADKKPDLEQQKKKVREAIGLDYCMKDLSRDQIECGLKAKSLEELEKTCDAS